MIHEWFGNHGRRPINLKLKRLNLNKREGGRQEEEIKPLFEASARKPVARPIHHLPRPWARIRRVSPVLGVRLTVPAVLNMLLHIDWTGNKGFKDTSRSRFRGFRGNREHRTRAVHPAEMEAP